MVYKIDIEECLRDSPKFRSLLEEEETNIDQLEQKLDKILKICGTMIDTGKTYVAQQSLFANSLWDLSLHFREDSIVLSSLNKLIQSLQEMNKFHTILLDQASRIILKNLTSFVKNDIKNVRDYKQHFDKISTEYDNVILRNSQTPRNKVQEVEEIQNVVLAVRSCFRHNALDYVNSICLLQSRKRHEILSTLLSYMHACTTYYHQGSDLCADLDGFLKNLAEEINTMIEESYRVEKDLQNRHSSVNNSELISIQNDKNFPIIEGYLFKRTSNAFKTWHRRWFYLFDNKLLYRKRSGEEQETVMEDDLRLCTVKPVHDGDRRFCFEVLSPLKSHMLQADSKEMYDAWIEAMQKGIGAAFQRVQSSELSVDNNEKSHTSEFLGKRSVGDSDNTNTGNKTKKLRMWEQLVKIPGNNYCCDCNNPNPRWASINLGITLCIECSGVHRSLGVHYSKVRSLTLDDWEPENIKVMCELGNTIVNKIYEANVPENYVRATPDCLGTVRENWIRTKYVDKKFVKTLPKFDESNEHTSRSSLMDVRKWSVRKIRRRPRSCDNSRKRTPLLSKSNEDVTRNVLLFGNDLDKPSLNGTIDLSSDQESTGGEDDDVVEEEDIAKLHPDLLLYKASMAHNLPVMCEALALGADKQWINADDKNRTAIHQAVLSGSVMPLAYLISNGAKINSQDIEGQTPLHLATAEGHTAQVCLLLKHRADQHIENNDGSLPLSMAEKNEDADIVTLLRLGRLNDEMKESDSGLTSDSLFVDVVRDFSHLACSNPEKLNRIKSDNE